ILQKVVIWGQYESGKMDSFRDYYSFVALWSGPELPVKRGSIRAKHEPKGDPAKPK
ncbi:unnamed protein product, partial [marine sediment metagenome]